jgi:hypothetical protein
MPWVRVSSWNSFSEKFQMFFSSWI